MQQFQKSVQLELKPVQPVSALFPSVTASLPVSPVRKSHVQFFGKPVQPNFESGSTEFETGSTEFQSDFPNGHQLLGAPLYTPPTLFPTGVHAQNSISNLRNTFHSLSHTSCLSHFKSLERNLWVSLRAAGFVLHLQISFALLHSSFGTTSSSLWIHYSWSF